MEFLKKHYEKILLALVLLGLMAAVVDLLILVPQKQKEMTDLLNVRLNPPVTPLARVKPELFELNAETEALQKVETPLKLDFTTGHNLFNPVLWQLLPNGRLRKIQTGNEIGPGALEILAINPIYLVVTSTNAANGYLLAIYREVPGISRPVDERHTIVSNDRTNEYFNLKEVGGQPENPQLTLEMKATHETFIVSSDKPYRRVDGYTVDLKYPPDPNLRPWLNLRPGQGRNSVLTFENGTYFLIDVGKDYIVVSSQLNNKKTTIHFNSAATEPH